MYVADDKRYDSTQYRRSGRSGIQLPAVSLGLWHNFGGVDNFENSRAMLRRAFDLGITHFDLANNYGPPYGSAEETFGQILKKDFLPTLSRGEAEWKGLRGYVQEHLPEIVGTRTDMHAYICGLNKMIKANRELLKSLGWDRTSIRYEKYD